MTGPTHPAVDRGDWPSRREPKAPKPIVATASFDNGQGFLGVIRMAKSCLPCEACSFEELLPTLARCVKENRSLLVRGNYDVDGPRKVVFCDHLPVGPAGSPRSLDVSGRVEAGKYSAECTVDSQLIRVEATTFDELVRQLVLKSENGLLKGELRIRLCLEAPF